MTDHDLLASGVIDAELARLILGGRGRARPELRMDAVGHLARHSAAILLCGIDLGRRLLPVMEKAAAGLADLAKWLEYEAQK